MVVVGIGGSYLGARTVIEALAKPNAPQVLFAGQTLSADYFAHLRATLKGKRFCLNVISKSGTTTEPAIAFRLLREQLISQVGAERAKQLIIATTDPEKGALRQMAAQLGYKTFPIPTECRGTLQRADRGGSAAHRLCRHRCIRTAERGDRLRTCLRSSRCAAQPRLPLRGGAQSAL